MIIHVEVTEGDSTYFANAHIRDGVTIFDIAKAVEKLFKTVGDKEEDR